MSLGQCSCSASTTSVVATESRTSGPLHEEAAAGKETGWGVEGRGREDGVGVGGTGCREGRDEQNT